MEYIVTYDAADGYERGDLPFEAPDDVSAKAIAIDRITQRFNGRDMIVKYTLRRDDDSLVELVTDAVLKL